MGGIPMVAAVGAPSSLAVQVAKEFDITLVGFLRKDHFNIYHGSTHIVGYASASTEVGE
jgi:FdhD protein